MVYKLYVGGLENLRKTRFLTDIVKDFAVEKENKLSQLGNVDIMNYDFSLHVKNEDDVMTLQFRQNDNEVVTCSVNNGIIKDLIVTEEAGSEIVNFHDAKDVLETLSNQFDLGHSLVLAHYGEIIDKDYDVLSAAEFKQDLEDYEKRLVSEIRNCYSGDMNDVFFRTLLRESDLAPLRDDSIELY